MVLLSGSAEQWSRIHPSRPKAVLFCRLLNHVYTIYMFKHMGYFQEVGALLGSPCNKGPSVLGSIFYLRKPHIYIYIHIHRCMRVYIHTHACIYIHIYIYVHVLLQEELAVVLGLEHHGELRAFVCHAATRSTRGFEQLE